MVGLFLNIECYLTDIKPTDYYIESSEICIKPNYQHIVEPSSYSVIRILYVVILFANKLCEISLMESQ